MFHDFMQTDRQTDLVKQKEAALNEKEMTPFMDEIEICLFSQPEVGIMSGKEWTSGSTEHRVT